jgi:hypothetical protein
MERVLCINHIWVVEFLHNGKFSIFITPILEHFLNGDCLTCLVALGFIHGAERTLSDNFVSDVGVTGVSELGTDSVLKIFVGHL